MHRKLLVIALTLTSCNDQHGGFHDLDTRGMLGVPSTGTFLANILATDALVNHQKRLLHLSRYSSRAHIRDEFVRAGFSLEPNAFGYVVGVVFAGSDAAAKQLQEGELVRSVDGQTLAGLDAATAEGLLVGNPGETRRVRLGNRTVDIAVEELLPL